MRRTVVLSGPRRRAAKGRFSCRVVAVDCNSKHVLIAASIWALVNGFRDSGRWSFSDGVLGAGVLTTEFVDEVGVNGVLVAEVGVPFLVTLV